MIAQRQRERFRRILLASGVERVILHIGLEKTGSTFLQLFLLENYNFLVSNGILFPKSLLDTIRFDEFRGATLSGHEHFVDILGGNPPRQKDVLCRFEAELSKANVHTVMFSAEGLCNPRNAHALSMAGQMLSGLDVEAIVVLRRPDLWAESFYKEIVSNGFIREGRRYSGSWFDLEIQHRSPTRLFEILNESYSEFSLRALHYEALRTSNEAYILEFLDILGLTQRLQDFTQPNTGSNLSFGRQSCEIFRMFNAFTSGLSFQEFRLAYDDLRARIGTELPDDRMRMLSPDERRRLVELWSGLSLIENEDVTRIRGSFLREIERSGRENWVPLENLPIDALEKLTSVCFEHGVNGFACGRRVGDIIRLAVDRSFKRLSDKGGSIGRRWWAAIR